MPQGHACGASLEAGTAGIMTESWKTQRGEHVILKLSQPQTKIYALLRCLDSTVGMHPSPFFKTTPSKWWRISPETSGVSSPCQDYHHALLRQWLGRTFTVVSSTERLCSFDSSPSMSSMDSGQTANRTIIPI